MDAKNHSKGPNSAEAISQLSRWEGPSPNNNLASCSQLSRNITGLVELVNLLSTTSSWICIYLTLYVAFVNRVYDWHHIPSSWNIR